MKDTTMKVKITLQEDILGTLSGDSEIYRNYLASKNPNTETVDSEAEAIDRAVEQMTAEIVLLW